MILLQFLAYGWVLGLAVSNINESQLQTYESKTLFLMSSLQNYCIPGLTEIKTYAKKMHDAQVTKSLLTDVLFCLNTNSPNVRLRPLNMSP